ncbi:uncharacterized protein NEMAJ01_0664 [Nematocida major]|uniref:uncharacterized protein n=1 Tax=Nematocida major TaxID=1912982 RepID=UPI0020087DE5|nr:uncharacterized protein NEMAJ01_0664 [Nematocida major]KAH9385768.1 hypothetical protein NEMAJ01_0664 [Nematocida major]
MHRKWLKETIGQFKIEIKGSRAETHGFLVGIKGRKEWKFHARSCATVQDLCEEMQRQTRAESVGPVEKVHQMKIIDMKEEVEIVVEGKKVFYIEISKISIDPNVEEGEGRDPIMELNKIGTKKRTCRMCKTRIALYRRVRDVLVGPEKNVLCVQCYTEFHWGKNGEKKYEGFIYEPKRG